MVLKVSFVPLPEYERNWQGVKTKSRSIHVLPRMKHGHFCTPVHTDLNYRHLPFRQITKQNASFPLCNYLFLPVPMTTRSKAWVCSHSSAEIVGSNPSRGKDVRLLCVLCVVRHSSLRRADHSSRGFLPSVVRIVCDLETWTMRRPWPALCRSTTGGKKCQFLLSVWHKIYITIRDSTVCYSVTAIQCELVSYIEP